jgi:hypothetical protein
LIEKDHEMTTVRKVPSRSFIVALALLLPCFQTAAQGCGAPALLTPPTTSQAANTAWSQNWLPVLGGVLPSPQRDVVYRIPANSGYALVQVRGLSTNTQLLGVGVLDACSNWANLLDYADVPIGSSGFVSVGNSAADRFVVVTGDPNGPAGGYGGYELTARFYLY